MSNKISNSLIPIKGISQSQKNNLNSKCKIYDISGLLVNGRTPDQRQQLARTLAIDKRYVDIWVKQADLWRVNGMTEDFAYLLVLAGVRCVNDLAKVDAEKALPVINAISNTHPDFVWDASQLVKLVENAKLLDSIAGSFQFEHSSRNCTIDVSDEAEPSYLFYSAYQSTVLDQKSESQIISEGLRFLQDITVALPLPHIISGKVKIRTVSEKDSEAKVTDIIPNILVEIGGIVNPSVEATEGKSQLSAYTDSNGRFSIIMPDKYCMQDLVTFTFSSGGYKQCYSKQASEIIESTVIRDGGKDEKGKPLSIQKLLFYFDKLDSINKEIQQNTLEYSLFEKLDTLNEKLNTLDSISDEYRKVEEEIRIYQEKKDEAGLFSTAVELREIIKAKKAERTKILNTIYGADPTTNDFEKTLTNILSRTDLEACFDGEDDDTECRNHCFILVEEVFKSYTNTQPRALPSVKLMGEDDKATWLPTDRAPSRTYSYTLLQRLVEPSISPAVGTMHENGRSQRKKLTEPLDISAFKEQMYTNPDSIPKMSSLGMGYILNMHQEWVPDGFALGTLLYSLILAPGEEQRLIVRENTQNYNIVDTSEGLDSTQESYSRSQTDDIQALYDYLLSQDSQGSSSSKYSTSSWSIGGSLSGGYGGIAGGLTGGYSKSSGSASASARQTNNHSEASQAAQSFNQRFSTASSALAEAKRVSIRTASDQETDSVATKIIANHNHSHAMTIQYWEVVRRYRLETCIEGVELLLFVPLKPVRFLPVGQPFNYILGESFTKDMFNARYESVLRYYNVLNVALPSKYRSGLNLIQRYASLPKWEFENLLNSNPRTIKLSFESYLFIFDEISAQMVLKNGKGSIAAEVSYEYVDDKDNEVYFDTRECLPDRTFETSDDLKRYIRTKRNKNTSTWITCIFTLPFGVLDEDISHINLSHTCDNLSFTLWQNPKGFARDECGDTTGREEVIQKYYDNLYNLMKDDKWNVEDTGKTNFWKSQLPEAYYSPIVNLSSSQIISLGAPIISNLEISEEDLAITATSRTLSSTVTVNVLSARPALRYAEFQQMEATLQHIASETMRYSQLVWQSLSDNELAMMLEQYSIDMNFQTYFDTDDSNTQIPLLNCVNVKKVIGFYGNCILLPFTYPEELAKKIGKTAAEVQDALYRYHTSCFRAPSTTISIPTDGMIGEAVLGSTNVSEEIDLTRFWNWKDSPIDSMTLDSSYLNGNDYLSDKNTKDISALNLQTATAATPVTSADLISALVSKQTPSFDNITGLDQISSILNTATNTTATGRDNVVNQSAALTNKAMDYITEKLKTESQENIARIKANPNSTSNLNMYPEEPEDPEDPEEPEEPEEPEDPEDPEDPEENIEDMDPEENEEHVPDAEDADVDYDLLNTIIQGAIEAMKEGTSPEEYFAQVTNSDVDSSEIQEIAQLFCSQMGEDLNNVIDKIME